MVGRAVEELGFEGMKKTLVWLVLSVDWVLSGGGGRGLPCYWHFGLTVRFSYVLDVNC